MSFESLDPIDAPPRRQRSSNLPCGKKARGVYYTPAHIVDEVVKHTIGKLLEGKTPTEAARLRILDPACGVGAFMLGAFQYLVDWHLAWYAADGTEKHGSLIHLVEGNWRLTCGEKKRILLNNICGVDIDANAVETAKNSLFLKLAECEAREAGPQNAFPLHEHLLPNLDANIQCGNALLGPDFCDGQRENGQTKLLQLFDWTAAFPEIGIRGGFDAVIGNPPWGQKAVAAEPKVKRYLWNKYPSSRGIFDLFRPFVEQGIRLLKDGGMFGFVLPDIILLKDYVPTRRHLLEQLALARIDWWGSAFADAVIDAATIVGCKRSAPPDHRVQTCVRDSTTPHSHAIHQSDFWVNPRFVFNVHLTPEKNQLLKVLEACPRLGDYFEVHEGVHSGNIRQELFVSTAIDATCRELYFGRGEIVPFHLDWQGRYIRLAALPESKTAERYANLGKPEWHERDKVLVRRTGDHVLAAVDQHRRHASNNFFVVFPSRASALDLHGLCALLNSRFMTWYFRTIEPRRGRVFAELKIKHLGAFPLPLAMLDRRRCQQLNMFGAKRAIQASQLASMSGTCDLTICKKQAAVLDRKIETLVCRLLGLPGDFEATQIGAATSVRL